MARSFTVDQLVSRVRLLNDYLVADQDYSGDAPRAPSSGTLIGWLDAGNAYAWNIYAHADEGWYTTRHTFSTVAGSGTYDLPDDFLIARAVEGAMDDAATGWVPLRRATVDDDSSTSSTGGSTDFAYRWLGSQVELIPSPGQVTQIRLTYTPHAQVLSSSLQTVDGVDGYEQVVVLKACILARIREGQGYADLEAQLNEHLEQMNRNVKRRDRGTPYHARPRSGWFGRWPGGRRR